ncbi:MAG: PIN domain-containing protein [Tannerella sp.]|nr:PIN domain-containing protein [Tannerella sp.]
MVILDTNAILRYILQDNKEMADEVEIVLTQNVCFIPVEVIAEMVYVLNMVYSLDRSVICQIITDISLSNDVIVEHQDVVRYAVQVYSNTGLDFVDCLLTGYSKINDYTVFTFDKKLKNQLKQ